MAYPGPAFTADSIPSRAPGYGAACLTLLSSKGIRAAWGFYRVTQCAVAALLLDDYKDLYQGG